MKRRQWGRLSPKAGGALSVLGLALLMALEQFVPHPYQDGAEVWTEGYGHTAGVGPHSPTVTEPQARATLVKETNQFAKGIDACLDDPITQHQYDAYLILSYNIGVKAFCSSSTLKLHNEGQYAQACDAMLKWNKITVHGHLVYSKGLDNRRHKERDLCLTQ